MRLGGRGGLAADADAVGNVMFSFDAISNVQPVGRDCSNETRSTTVVRSQSRRSGTPPR